MAAILFSNVSGFRMVRFLSDVIPYRPSSGRSKMWPLESWSFRSCSPDPDRDRLLLAQAAIGRCPVNKPRLVKTSSKDSVQGGIA